MKTDKVFPTSQENYTTQIGTYNPDYMSSGLTKRELFAAMAMQSLLSNPERYKYIANKVANGMSQEEASSKNAHKAVLLADALINELNKMRQIKFKGKRQKVHGITQQTFQINSTLQSLLGI